MPDHYHVDLFLLFISSIVLSLIFLLLAFKKIRSLKAYVDFYC